MTTGTCEAPRCEYGWVIITQAAVERMVPEPSYPEGDTPEVQEACAKMEADFLARRAAAVNTWYPCKECNPTMFFRWVNGHLDKSHDRASCPECKGSKRAPVATGFVSDAAALRDARERDVL